MKCDSMKWQYNHPWEVQFGSSPSWLSTTTANIESYSMPCRGACRSSQAKRAHDNPYGHLHRWSSFSPFTKTMETPQTTLSREGWRPRLSKPCLSCLSPSICGERVQTALARFICPAFPFGVHGAAKTSQVIGM